ncbi:MAG TPA: VOC family protein [Dongiaceae bacterium]|jgi:catechol 2,3-dioxygenase-like lactoylglutathione lyase family enzyme
MRLDHFTLRTRKPVETVRFYVEGVGLKEGWRPGFRFPGHWLYNGDTPVVHIVTVTDDESELRAHVGERKEGPGSGSVDHIAFRCDGLKEYQERLLKAKLPFRERVVPNLDQHQLFVQDPNGVTVELVFDHDESNQIRGEAVAPPNMVEAK